MGLYETERDKISRTPQIICKVGMTQCENFYATTVKQLLQYTEDLTNAVWTLLGGATRSGDTGLAPDNTTTADRLIITANGDGIEQISGAAAAGKAFTFSLFGAQFSTATNPITITIEIADGAAESTTKQIGITGTWQRFTVAKKFTGGAVGNVRIRIKGVTGDTALGGSLLPRFWGANLSENPGDLDAEVMFPYVKRANEADTVLATMVSRCQAVDAGVGSRCTYSDSTCQDKANINLGNNWAYQSNTSIPPLSNGDPKNGIKEFKFCLKDAPLPVAGADIWPMLKEVVITPQKIEPEKSVTESENIKLSLYDDATRANWNQDKANLGALTNTGAPSATFWRRFMPIYPNYPNPRNYVTVNVGFVAIGAIESDFQVRGKYVITNLELDNSGIAIMTVKDRLWLTRKKAPAKISDTNLLNGAINSAVTSLVVDDGSELTIPASNATTAETYGSDNFNPFTYGKRLGGPDYLVTILIDSEFMNVTGISGNTLTVERGRWGSSAASHSDNVGWKEVLMFGTERTSPDLAPLGKNPIDIAYQLLARGGLSLYNDLDTTTLNAQREAWLPTQVFPNLGVEIGPTFKRAGNALDAGNGGISIQVDIQGLLTEIREAAMLTLLSGEDQKVTGRIFAPPAPSVTLTTLTDGENLLKNSIEIDDNKESRFTICLVAYDLIAGADGKKLADYQKVIGRGDVDGLQPSGYGDRRTRVILSPWIRSNDSATPSRLAVHMLGRFKNGARKVKGRLEVKDDALKCGDFATLMTSRIVRFDGASDSRIMEIQSKERDPVDHTLTLLMQDTGLIKRYMTIAPAGTPDYNSQSAAQKRYGSIGSAFVGTVGNKVGTLKEDGYYIF